MMRCHQKRFKSCKTEECFCLWRTVYSIVIFLWHGLLHFLGKQLVSLFKHGQGPVFFQPSICSDSIPVNFIFPLSLCVPLLTWSALSSTAVTEHCLFGLVVKAPALWGEHPGFESCLRRDFSGVESYRWRQNWHSSGYPARRLVL